MKKMYKMLLCAVSATMLFSCVKENFEDPQEKPIPDGYEMQEFTATTVESNQPLNRTTVEVNDDGSHGATLWAKGDQLSILWDGDKGTADLEGEGGEKTGKFKGVLPQGMRASHAVYPSSVTASVDGNTVKVAIPAEQNGTFSAGNIAVAEVAEDNSLAFNNVNAFLCVQLVSDDITKITIESVGGKALVGTIPVTFTDGKAECDAVENGTEKVTMTAGAAGRYYVSIVPGETHSEGLLMTYYKGEEVSGTYQLNKQLTPVANKIYNFGEFEPDYNYYVTKDGAGKKTGTTWRDAISIAQMVEMVFEDPNNTVTKVLDDKLNGATFHIEEGEYELDTRDRTLRFVNDDLVKLTFIGSYDSETHKRDLENGRTSFTGNNSHCIVNVNCNKDECCDMDITFDGIGFINGTLGGGEDGALYCNGSKATLTLNIKNCEFKGNKNSDGTGSAICLHEVDHITIDNTLFEDNSAKVAGAMLNTATDGTFNNCIFKGNWTGDKAGVAYFNYGGDNTFNNCEFIDNAAFRYGMILHDGGTTTFNNCKFISNEVSGSKDGGAFTVLGGSSGTLKINGGEISGNYAGWGAALYVEKSTQSKIANIVVNDVVIKDNETNGSGTVWIDSKATFTRCTFENNKANSSDYDSGHSLTVATGADLQLYGCTIKNHSSANRISSVLVRTGAKLTMGEDANGTRSVVQNNTTNYGGAIRVKGEAEISGTDFIENYANGGGAIIVTDEGELTVDDCLFEDNYAKNNFGGAIRFESTGDFTVLNSTFRGNHNNSGSNGTRGGAISTAKCDVVIDNCLFENNYCEVTSGAAFAAEEETTGIKITNTTFVGNTSGQNSGAVWLCNHCDTEFENCTFIENSATNNGGGAVRMDSAEGTFTFNRCHFEDNSAKQGAAFYVYSWLSRVYMNACTFTGNHITGDAAGTTIWLYEYGNFNMNNCTIADDTYTSGGTGSAASWIEAHYCTAERGMCFSNNTFIGSPRTGSGATTGGGLIRMNIVDYASDDQSEVDNYHFINNIIVTENPASNKAIVDFGNEYTRSGVMCYTKHSGYSGTKGTFSSVESPASDGFSKADFGGLKWNENGCYWSWNGTMTGGNNKSMITKDQFVSALNNADPQFKAWLEGKGELNVDQLGHDRGTGDWWPGSYQPGRVVAGVDLDVAVTTFNLRSSDSDEKADERKWSNRKAGVFAWFNQNTSPFVCVQECTDEQRREILANCNEYDVVDRMLNSYEKIAVHGLTHANGADDYEPVKIFYKKADVENVISGTFWLTDTPNKPSKMSNQNQHRMAQWMKCTYRGTPMVVIAAHISYKTATEGEEGDHPNMQTLRESEMGVIKTWISNPANYNPEVDGPVVLAGDFNTSQGNSVFTYWRNNNDDCGWYYARDTMYENDKNACDTGRTFNNWVELGGSGQLTIDHQFYSGFSDVKSYLVDREPYAGVQFLSDHWPLTVVYEF